MKSGIELTSKTDTSKLSDEIYHVYCEVRAIIPDVHRRIGLADPTWILLETAKKEGATEKQATMRDYVTLLHSSLINQNGANELGEC